MARAGVNYHDIAKAAESVKLQGQEPTVDRVREQLGTGSKSTIAPLLKRWRTESVEEAKLGGLPADLIQVVKALHERLHRSAEIQIEQARAEFKTADDKRSEELKEAKLAITELTAQRGNLKTEVERLTVVNGRQSQASEETRIALSKAESQRDESNKRVEELRETVTELKQENRDVRRHFEHYQQSSAEDRLRERDRFRESTQQLKAQSEAMSVQLAQAQSRIAVLAQANELLQKDSVKLDMANNELKSRVNQKTNEVQVLKKELKKIHKYEDERAQLTERSEVLSSQKSALEKELAVLIQALGSTKSELETTKDKLTTLTDENKIILQEKAVFQGQLKQLQASL